MKVPITNIHIVGLGVAEQAILADATQAVIRQADVILGSARQLQTIQGLLAEPLHHADNQQATNKKIIKALPALKELPVLKELPTLKELPDVIACYPNSSIVVLASGDPLYYGIGRWFSQRYGLQGAVKGSDENVFFYPAISSIQAACHQLGFSLQDVTVISLHGRPLEKIRTQLHANKRLVVLTDKNSQPSVLAKECIAAGFTASQITVCENLGYPQQQVRTFSVQALCEQKSDQESEQKSEPLLFDPLHVSVIEVKGDGGLLPNFPGIPDEHYLTGELAGKGMISKREVRLVILSFMQISTQDVV